MLAFLANADRHGCHQPCTEEGVYFDVRTKQSGQHKVTSDHPAHRVHDVAITGPSQENHLVKSER